MATISTFSNVIRERHLQKNITSYKGTDFIFKNTEFYTFHTHPLKSITNGEGLYNYTHSETTDYSQKIGHLYFKHRRDYQPYINIDPINPQNFWGGEFHDYYDYVGAVYGQVTPPIQIIQGLISPYFLDEALRVTSPGVVHNPEPTLSMAGAIKTNINNFSGTDTRLGLLGNQMYAHSLYHGANFNTLRKENNQEYITPSVKFRFGNSNYTINALSSIVSAVGNDGRIVDDYNYQIGIIHDLGNIPKQTKIVKKDKETRKQENADYKNLKAKYDEELKAYNKALKEYKNGDRDVAPTKPTKPEKPSKTTTEEVEADDYNFVKLYERLELNKYFYDKNFIPYGNDVDYFTKENELYGPDPSKSSELTQHKVYNDNNEGVYFDEKETFWYSKMKLTPDAQTLSTEFDHYEPFKDINDNITHNRSMLWKTNQLFHNSKINTIYGEHLLPENEINNLGFGNFVDEKHKKTSFDTSTSSQGRSRGRNLLKKDKDARTNGLKNPFCRTWTYHHQYDRIDKLVRSFSDDEGKTLTVDEVQKFNSPYRAKIGGKIENGDTYLSQNTVLNNNTGIVNIAPSMEGKVDIKKCMFSIENLAWKDVLNKEEYLSKEQRGPNGGRIMWFPPYDLNFSENTNVNWESNTFIGRGEKVYTYSNTDRTGSLSFTLLIDHPSTIHNIYETKDEISDDDILRFFAGCGVIKPNVIEEEKEEEEKEEQEKEKGKDPDTKIPEPNNSPETKEFSIYVYFPNNYTGHWHNLVKSKNENSTKEPDEDFLEYMLFGCSAHYDSGIPEEYQFGYEMGEHPISLTGEIDEIYKKPPYTIPQCGVKKIYSDECKLKDKQIKQFFYYRVDADFKQVMTTVKNGEDEISYSLNSHNDNDEFQFIHLAYAIFKKKATNAQGDKYTELLNKLIDKYSGVETGGERLLEVLNRISSTQTTKLTFTGGASMQDGKNSATLATRRCATLRKLIVPTFEFSDDIKIEVLENDINVNSESNSDRSIKENRYACVTFKYEVSNTQTLNDSENPNEEKKENDGSVLTKTVSKKHTRYEDEAQYFNKLAVTDNTTFKSLKKKFKYFTPAFHSISPEGFNARLTFLQQCTRQGHTIESRVTSGNGDKPTAVAGNLAFGRMPVCILRIGDFMYTRILITSMNISYENNQWDLNPEGIGVQPMMAKVNLGITILGGQSLEGPISKLQNAVTFNYYANAGVYDDRADRGKPKEEGNKWSTDYYYTWEPEYLGTDEE